MIELKELIAYEKGLEDGMRKAVDICCRHCIMCELDTETKKTYCDIVKELCEIPSYDVIEREQKAENA